MKPLQEELDEAVAQLYGLLCDCSTHSVASGCSTYFITDQQSKTERPLTSPGRQIPFLLGVLLSSPEPEGPIAFGRAEWERVKTLLNRIFLAYTRQYVPQKEDRGRLTVEWKRIREVAMLAFLHYFNTVLMASVEQMKERIAAYITPFDDSLRSLIGIGSNDAVAICQFISERLQEHLDEFQTTASELCSQGKAFWEQPSSKGAKLVREIQRLGLIRLTDIECQFPLTAHAFWQRFSISRGEGPSLRYPTEQGPFEFRPLIRIDDHTAFCVTGNSLFSAVLMSGEKALIESTVRDRFTRARDKSLEGEVARFARELLGPNATIWKGVYETPDAQHEHDVVAFDNRIVIFFEAKASPPEEPFRDPEKAFPRIRQAFRSDTGIQKAYEQGNRVIRRLKKGDIVSFFDQDGREKGSLNQGSRFAVCACITRDDFGPLATNLSLLLKKDLDDAYPWAANVVDLALIAEAWAYFRWGSEELRAYLRQRLELHGKVFSADELDYVGYFIQHGGFSPIIGKNAVIQLGPDYSDVFDAIYRHLHAGGPPVIVTRRKPVLTDPRLSLAFGTTVLVPTDSGYAKVGRNEPCPCGSGRKYKKCHGQ